MTESKESTVRLLITCPDQPGIVASVSRFLHRKGANIIHSDQHSTDPEGGRFFMRNEFYLPGLDLEGLDGLREEFEKEVTSGFTMDWSLNPVWEPKKMVILCSKVDHALMELLWRWKRGDLEADIAMVISNHPDLRESVEHFVPFHYVPVGPTLRDKVAAEDRIIELMGEVDILVLARYMQILTPDFVARFSNQIINIHHSFLPAFVGADPYRRAFERGVKLIGATAHYVTKELDEGPIIEQDVIRVTHSHDVDALKSLGADIERHVLARAVKWHLEDRVIVDGNKTIVFRR
ncbi:Formyltetrahydrofolate deformylase [Pseudodesulfovibrio profundus]|uniref:Formyltetrahydrofolate deformylase n=1 Tax=Pseudodesulfovibrio profundus TaxID=57320 RepID=A0A2C8FD27_9BACT|nr:formyltetrahydrofolate deformylase [Pseudodesulfovibrio profundus]MBC15616.1 formyltetrahydrofolate deformylase [Desulfovibrio sp.]SOB59802.1 Formyltetrahydrofolate deformylase [Pseudodesulfovibrio profundus]|tara:strand:- start:2661 stop:3536 length:876 start_codon:yes stop_codon:yes gene_type:complete